RFQGDGDRTLTDDGARVIPESLAGPPMNDPSISRSRRTVRLIGLPTDVNSSFLRGPAKGPAAIRAALASDHTSGSAEIGDTFGQDVQWNDIGDLPLGEDESDAAQIESAVAHAIASGEMPFSLGGDHSITFPVMRAVARAYGAVNILHFDA